MQRERPIGTTRDSQRRYQPRIQEGGLAEAWVGVHWAAGREAAQREATCNNTRIREGKERAAAHSGTRLAWRLGTSPLS